MFARRLEDAAARIERRLDSILGPPWAGEAQSHKLVEAMRYAVLGGGKRFRPFLVIECAALCGVEGDGALDAAAALECLHCYSLAHDDLPAMDDDALRRGRPTLHVAFGEATAILAGDALLTLAFEIMARPETHPDAEVRAALMLGLARAAGPLGMAGGQALDLEAEGRTLSADAIRRMQQLKTGALIAFACEAGAIVARASDGDRDALKAYGEGIGRAFQLADDLLDYGGDAARLGKAARKDSAAGKATLVAALGVERAREELAGLVAQAQAALAPFGPRAATLSEAARFAAARER